MTTIGHAHNRINDIIARQRASRVRDLLFAVALAAGFGLSFGAMNDAGATSTAPAATATAAPVVTSA